MQFKKIRTKYIYIKGEGDTALEAEAQLYSDNSIIGK